jgi:hypothetical protein
LLTVSVERLDGALHLDQDGSPHADAIPRSRARLSFGHPELEAATHLQLDGLAGEGCVNESVVFDRHAA